MDYKSDICAICMEPNSTTQNNKCTTTCGHSFHTTCFVLITAICPICRTNQVQPSSYTGKKRYLIEMDNDNNVSKISSNVSNVVTLSETEIGQISSILTEPTSTDTTLSKKKCQQLGVLNFDDIEVLRKIGDGEM